ncbi:MAG: hypothetical protein QOK29_915 [Rhodospirillaceae bacterium]|jgi:ectoine hydroxylase-related dioxygenase (phytanoyl-CoA dioxygenase family)|nr:hypothetical protein [Rhodospirillaceae bacterium]
MGTLTAAQAEQYKTEGYVVARSAVTAAQLAALKSQIAAWIEESRSKKGNYGETQTGHHRFDLEAGHSADRPRLRRINTPSEISEIYSEVAFESAMVDMVAEAVSPNLKFLQSKINLKLPSTDTRVGYHQDFAFVPHSNDDVATALLMLDDMTVENGCLKVVPGSHLEGQASLWQGDFFAGEVAPDVVAECERRAVEVTGPAGSVCIMHGHMLHGSHPNRSAHSRGLFICMYSAADAFLLRENTLPNRDEGKIVRGTPTRLVRLKPGTVELPEKFRSTSFFEVQGQKSVYAD